MAITEEQFRALMSKASGQSAGGTPSIGQSSAQDLAERAQKQRMTTSDISRDTAGAGLSQEKFNEIMTRFKNTQPKQKTLPTLAMPINARAQIYGLKPAIPDARTQPEVMGDYVKSIIKGGGDLIEFFGAKAKQSVPYVEKGITEVGKVAEKAITGIGGGMETAGKAIQESGIPGVKPLGQGIEYTGSAIKDVPGDFEEFKTGIAESMEERGSAIREIADAYHSGEQGLLRSTAQATGQMVGGLADAIGEAFMLAGKTVLTDNAEKVIGDTIKSVGGDIMNSKDPKTGMSLGEAIGIIGNAYEDLKVTNPAMARDLSAGLGLLNFITEVTGLKAGKAVLKGGKEAVEEGVKQEIKQEIKGVAKGTAETAEGGVKEVAQKEVSGVVSDAIKVPTRIERMHGIDERVKTAISRNPERFDVYAKSALDGHMDFRAKPPIQIAAEATRDAFDKLNKVIEDVGTPIGKFRESIKSVRVPQKQVDEISMSLQEQVGKSGMRFSRKRNSTGQMTKEYELKQVPGRTTSLRPADQAKLMEFWNDINSLRKNNTMENLIDVRNKIQKEVTFGKAAREISSEIDPIAKGVRAKIRDINLKNIPPEQAVLMDEYSDLMRLLQDYNRATSKGKNIEFMLERAFSNRGEFAQDVMKRLSDITGIDVVNEAELARVATDMLGSNTSKTLFEQKIKNAALDAASLISPHAGAVIKTIQFGKAGINVAKNRNVIHSEKKELAEIMKNAARAGKDFNYVKPIKNN